MLLMTDTSTVAPVDRPIEFSVVAVERGGRYVGIVHFDSEEVFETDEPKADFPAGRGLRRLDGQAVRQVARRPPPASAARLGLLTNLALA